MDAERALITKAVQTAQLEQLVSMGVEERHFADPACREVWTFCLDHLRKYRTIPSVDTVRSKHPDFRFEPSTDALDYIAHEFVKNVKRRAGIEKIRDLARAVDDPNQIEDIDALFLEAARDIAQLVPSTRTQRFSDMANRIDLYKQMQKQGVLPGIPLGIKDFDDLTLGVQRHEYVSIVGWQGTGKSTLLQYMFFNAYLAGKTPMLISLEMEADALFKKWDTMTTNFQSHALRAMELGVGDIEKWEKWALRAEEASNDIIVLDDMGRCTVDKIFAETVRYQPDCVGVDYVSLMDSPGKKTNSLWENVTDITKGLKQNARSLKIPVYGVAQTNIMSADQGAKLENISYSRSIGQDSDLVFGLFQDDEMRAQRKMQVRMLKNRAGAISKTDMFWDMAHMRFRPWKDGDGFSKPGEQNGR